MKQAKRDSDFLHEIEQAESMLMNLDGEKQEFKNWVDQCLQEWSSNNKDIKPILLKLNKI